AQAPALPPAPARGCHVGPITNFLAADATRPGVIDLIFFGAQGSRVEFFECVDDALRPLGAIAGPPDAAAKLLEATTWDCARPSRSFVARTMLPDGRLVAGAYAVRTGSCATRFELGVPRRAAEGGVARVRVVDRWGIGDFKPRLCIAPPRGENVCTVMGFKKAVTIRTRRFRARMDGRWRIELRVGRHRVRRTVTVGGGRPPKAPPVVLATGDSTMQGVDNFLADELGDAGTVRSDVRVGTGVSKSNWQAIARAQVKRYQPRFTVMSLGVNEGFPMTTPAGAKVQCCGRPWLSEYVRRLRAMTVTYRRKTAAQVIWLTLPLPRSGPKTETIMAVNAAIVRAAQDMRRVSVLRMDRLFTPNGFTEVIRYRGRYIRVRTADGIHLNVSGTAIAARVVAAAIRKLAG
ncbi:MAG TPA: GDSL-type esterase/lipase family protein, partial [Solirubrobacteraceae bacterium]|nr:GDSL-type esterase/lipase family protein [Solirubrobacteraceae bacterium]